jgi:hypothetical protein
MTNAITKQEFDALFSYDAETGMLTRKVRMSQGTPAGSRVGWADKKGYTRLRVKGQCILAHRLAFLAMTGQMPDGDVDHINRNPSDNAWCNLRLADKSENGRNVRLNSSNTSGFHGVSWHRGSQSWQAKLGFRSKRAHIGYYGSAEEAAYARDCVAWLVDSDRFTFNFPMKMGLSERPSNV